MRKIFNFVSLLLLLEIFFHPQISNAQPTEDWPAEFVQVKQWTVKLNLVYDRQNESMNEHATSVWTGTLDRIENVNPQEELDWNGTINMVIDGVSHYSDNTGCHTTITTSQENDKNFFGIFMTKDGYRFGQGFLAAQIGKSVSECPNQTDSVNNGGVNKGGVTYSPNTWQVIRPFPEKGLNLSGSTTIDHSSPNQVENNALSPDVKVTVTWDFKPVQDFVCGPDVTVPVKVALATMHKYFEGLAHEDKIKQCLALHGKPVIEVTPPINAFFRAWDITRLSWMNADWLDDNTKKGFCDVPGDGVTDENEDPATCKHTVSHSGQCVLAGTLNYFTFGQMHRLCYNYALKYNADHKTDYLRSKQIQCVMQLGGCPSSRPGGIPSTKEIANYNATCSLKTTYSGPDVPTDEECTNPPDVIDPSDWDKPNMDWYIEQYKKFSKENSQVPIAFAEAAFDSGEVAVPPIENRPQCRQCKGGECLKCMIPPYVTPFHWTWLPGHN